MGFAQLVASSVYLHLGLWVCISGFYIHLCDGLHLFHFPQKKIGRTQSKILKDGRFSILKSYGQAAKDRRKGVFGNILGEGFFLFSSCNLHSTGDYKIGLVGLSSKTRKQGIRGSAIAVSFGTCTIDREKRGDGDPAMGSALRLTFQSDSFGT